MVGYGYRAVVSGIDAINGWMIQIPVECSGAFSVAMRQAGMTLDLFGEGRDAGTAISDSSGKIYICAVITVAPEHHRCQSAGIGIRDIHYRGSTAVWRQMYQHGRIVGSVIDNDDFSRCGYFAVWPNAHDCDYCDHAGQDDFQMFAA